MTIDEYSLPAWDRIDGIPDPLENRSIFGHDETLDLLCARYASGKMHHAWLLSGPRGIGKATLSARFAAHVFRYPDAGKAPHHYVVPSHDDAVERQVMRGAHPNHLHMRRPFNDEKKKWRKDLTVSEIRRTVSFFGSTAGESGWRVAVVDTADDLNANAANALLKILEEPPSRTIFLVLANAPRMLATIRSRCQKIQMRPPNDAQVIEALRNLGLGDDVAPQDLKLAALLAGGSVRRAINFLVDDGIELYRRFAALAGGQRLDLAEAHMLASELAAPKANDRYRLLLDIAHDYVSRRIRGEDEPVQTSGERQRQGVSTLAGWVDVWEKTRQSAHLADTWNLDRKQVILNLFSSLHEAA